MGLNLTQYGHQLGWIWLNIGNLHNTPHISKLYIWKVFWKVFLHCPKGDPNWWLCRGSPHDYFQVCWSMGHLSTRIGNFVPKYANPRMMTMTMKNIYCQSYTDKGINHARSWHNINDNIRRQAQWYNNFDKGGMKWRLMCPKFIWVANLYMWWTGNRVQSAKGVNRILKTEKQNKTKQEKKNQKKEPYKWKHT